MNFTAHDPCNPDAVIDLRPGHGPNPCTPAVAYLYSTEEVDSGPAGNYHSNQVSDAGAPVVLLILVLFLIACARDCK